MITSFVGWVNSFKEIEHDHFWVEVEVEIDIDYEIDQSGDCRRFQNRSRCFLFRDNEICWDITSVIAGYLNEQGEVTKVEVLL